MPFAFVKKSDLESPQLDSDADLSEKELKKRKKDGMNSMKLVNPLAVDLRAYESRVEKEIPKFKKYVYSISIGSISKIHVNYIILN